MRNDTLASRPHYVILDALRGVAALMVVAFHLLEAHSGGNHAAQLINHGYLAVDFFFLLSGFVVGYAYDGRWERMSVKDFFKIRLVRLQPMVIVGMIIGAIFFYFQDSSLFPGIHAVPVWKLLLTLLIGCTLIPLPTFMDIRGWEEMHPLDGPGWSLFFEYIANILYALVVRKFSKAALGVLVFLSALLLLHLAITAGDVVGGWSLTGAQLHIGFSRMLYPFFAGLLLCRMVKIVPVKNAFALCSLLLMVALSIPRLGGEAHGYVNGLYEAFIIICIFPLIVFIGAGGQIIHHKTAVAAKFLGDISYPIYITHYPLIYTYTAYVADKNMPLWQAWPIALLVFSSSIIIAYASLKLYDEPVRKWLKQKFLLRR